MIKTDKLTKIYKTKNSELIALNNVSFTLPDKGMIFVAGKSGSGKSTLINMLGGLDDITSGDVYVDGLNIANLSSSELDKYRNYYLGIIYQNYNLFENEKVIDNIKASSNIAGLKIDDSRIDEVLSELDLADIKNKYVKHLSGGQKQRVAIARALIKNPKIILADEPTGNLDTKTAKIIFSYLKKISETRLVVIISHDLKSAYDFADRILKISDGEITDDLIRNKDYCFNGDDFVLLDEDSGVSEEDLDAINQQLKGSKYKIKKKQKLFINHEGSDEESVESINLKNKKHNLKPSLNIAFKLMKNNITSLVLTVLLAVIVIGLLSLSLSFTAFDGKAAVTSVTSKYDAKTMILRKGYSFTYNSNNINKDYLIETDLSDDRKVVENYTGNVYPIYSISIPIYDFIIDGSQTFRNLNYNQVYAQSTLGVIGCDIEYIKHVFGKDFELLAGSLFGLEESIELIITDYIADGMIYGNPSLESDDPNDPYQKLMGITHFDRYKIAAIIKTNYKEKYGVFLDALDRIKREPHNTFEIQTEMTSSELFIDLQDDANSYLNFAYSINPNFLVDYRHDMATFGFFINSVLSSSEYISTSQHVLSLQGTGTYAVNVDTYGGYIELENNECILRAQIYNALFGTSVTSKDSPDFEEKEIYIQSYGFDQNTAETPRYSFKVKIVDVENYPDNYIIMRTNYNTLDELRKCSIYQYGYAIDKISEAVEVYESVKPYYFYNTLNCFDAVFNIINIISIFSDIFFIIAIVLIVVLFMVIVLHNLKVIKKEQYRIGVYKSLGYSNGLLTISVIINNIFIVLSIFILSWLFSYSMSFIANHYLQYGFAKYSNNTTYFDITLLTFKFKYTLYLNISIFVFTLLSSFIPLLAIRKIKPNRIINNAE